MRKALILALLIALATIGTVRAAERAEMNRLNYWKITNPCFNNEGKWYTR